MSEKTTLQTKITTASAGQALLDYVAGRFRYQSRDYWERMIAEGALMLNGQKAEPGQTLRAGDRLAYEVLLAEPPVDPNIQILHEEDSFLVAQKPAHLPSHADGNFIQNTFIYLLAQKLKAQGFGGKPRLTHRLDRETSGLMVVAKTRDAARNLSGQFEKGQVEKTYWAIVRGLLEKDQFEVSGSIGRDEKSEISLKRKVFPAQTPGAQEAKTLFEVLRRLSDSTLVLCRPQSGRTAQIRVHLASLGHPIVNDKLYGQSDGQFLEFVRQSKEARPGADLSQDLGPRHLLHAGRLAFSHPRTGQRLTFESELPKDMKTFLEKE